MTESAASPAPQPHPLDDCDADDCYKTMMTERTELIKARREAEDNLIKSIVQLSSALIVLLAGFVAQTNVYVLPELFPIVIASIALLVASLCAGLIEHLFSSLAYKAQLKTVEDYYTRQSASFAEPWANKWVNACQLLSFGTFVTALICIGMFAVLQAKEKSHGRSKIPTTASSPATATATATSSSTALSTTAGPARGRICKVPEIGGTANATPTPQKALSSK